MRTSSDHRLKPIHPVLRWALFFAGFIAIALATVGIFLPVLPTVPFLLLAVACFNRSSQRFHTWLLDHARLGPLIRPYQHGGGLPRTAKLKAIGLIWISIAISALFLLEDLWMRGMLLSIGLGVTFYLLHLPTLKSSNQDDAD